MFDEFTLQTLDVGDVSLRVRHGGSGSPVVLRFVRCLPGCARPARRGHPAGGDGRPTGRRITCPTMLLESAHDDLDIHGDPAAIWATWLDLPLDHRVVESGHHQAEEAPDQVAAALLDFLG